MSNTTVLAVGLDPKFADFEQFPDLNREVIGAYNKQPRGKPRGISEQSELMI